MNTLLLRLVGPMQAWGIQSNFKERDTGLEPSKSGVVGLLCAALGREREARIDDLAQLRMGVRVDREGTRWKDFHTAGKYLVGPVQVSVPAGTRWKDFHTVGKGGYLRASGGKERENAILSTRWYLADAAFLVGFENEEMSQLNELQAALRNPHWSLCLGRKAFVPSAPVYLKNGLQREQTLEDALRTFPWLGRERDRAGTPQLRGVIDDDKEGNIVRPDYPLSFALFDRRFAPRRVRMYSIDTPLERLEDC